MMKKRNTESIPQSESKKNRVEEATAVKSSTDKIMISEYGVVEDDSSDNGSDDDMLDMFASDDEFEKKLEEEKRKRDESIQKKKELVENAADIENEALKDNWDDADGYYCSYAGEIFGYKYRVVKENGKGVFSTVLCCVDIDTNETVAIKVLRSIEKMTKDAKNELSLLEEIKAKDPENTKHCIPVYKSFMYRNHLCIVFPYLALNLRDTLRKYGIRTGLSLMAVQTFGRQLFLALLHIKKLGIVHADIKPDNIMLKHNNSSLIQLTDFGNSFHESDADNLPTPYLCSRFYRAPEIILGLKYDCRIDVWSAGCTLCELFTGNVTFPGVSNNDMLRCIQNIKGPMPHHMVKKHIKSYIEMGREPMYTEDFKFKYYAMDSVTKTPIIKMQVYTKPTETLATIISQSAGGSENPKVLREFADFLDKCFMLDPEKRITPQDALRHPFLVMGS